MTPFPSSSSSPYSPSSLSLPPLHSALYFPRRLTETSTQQGYFFYIIVGLIIFACGTYNICFRRRFEAQMLRQQHQNAQIFRQDIISNYDDIENLWECDVCAFQNYKTQKHCMLCGTERDYKMLFNRLHCVRGGGICRYTNANKTVSIINTNAKSEVTQQAEQPLPQPAQVPAQQPLHSQSVEIVIHKNTVSQRVKQDQQNQQNQQNQHETFGTSAKHAHSTSFSHHNSKSKEEAEAEAEDECECHYFVVEDEKDTKERKEQSQKNRSKHVSKNKREHRNMHKSNTVSKQFLKTLNRRQLTARKRHEWIREINESTGEFRWKRNVHEMEVTLKKRIDSLKYHGLHENMTTSCSYSSLSSSVSSSSRSSPQSSSSVTSVGYISQMIPTRKDESPKMEFQPAEGTVWEYISSISENQFSRRENEDENQRRTHTSLSAADRDRTNSREGSSRPLSCNSFHGNPNDKQQYIRNAPELTLKELKEISGLSFQKKHAWFIQYCAALEIPWEFGHMILEIDRKNLLQNSCEQFLWCTVDQLHQSLRIRFMNEPGIDAGGLEREWFTLMTKSIFAITTGLFILTDDIGTYTINPISKDASEDHLMYFQAIGRFLGRALFEGVLIDAHLSLIIYKHILGIPISFSDLQFVDYELYKNLQWIRTHPGVDALGLEFSVNIMRYGETKAYIIDLVPDGRHKPVTDENKEEYIHARFQWIMLDSISSQIASLIKGLYAVIPKNLLSVFDHQELELLMCGIPDIDVTDWKNHTTYIGDRNSIVVDWFWEILHDFSGEERARLLQFTTGSARVPVQGFKALTMNDGRICRFTIQFIPKEECLYPRSHTCFNRLDIPLYSSKADLEAALGLVLKTGVTGFTIE